jgi:hypothetical protein
MAENEINCRVVKLKEIFPSTSNPMSLIRDLISRFMTPYSTLSLDSYPDVISRALPSLLIYSVWFFECEV